MQPTADIPGLTALRGLAAFSVAAFHLDYRLVPPAGLHKAVPLFTHTASAVDLFFLLSGFLMAHVYGGRLADGANPLPFLQARFARIWPLHMVTTIAVLVIASGCSLQQPHISFSLGALVLQPVMLQALAEGLTWNYPTWSLSTEAIAYIGFVFTARPLLRGRRPQLIAATLIATLIVLAAINGGRITHYHQLPALARTAADFGLGVLLFRWWAIDRHAVRKVARWVILPTLAVFLGTRWDPFLIVALMAALILAVEARGWAAAALRSRPLTALGDWSFSVYLWHAPLHFLIGAVALRNGIDLGAIDPGPAQAVIAATLLVTIAVSAFSYRYIERPARQALRRAVASDQPKTVGSRGV